MSKSIYRREAVMQYANRRSQPEQLRLPSRGHSASLWICVLMLACALGAVMSRPVELRNTALAFPAGSLGLGSSGSQHLLLLLPPGNVLLRQGQAVTLIDAASRTATTGQVVRIEAGLWSRDRVQQTYDLPPASLAALQSPALVAIVRADFRTFAPFHNSGSRMLTAAVTVRMADALVLAPQLTREPD